MSPEESLKVCRLAKALSPAQAVDEYMPEAWHLVLRHWRAQDAMTALEQLGGEQEWLHVSHVVGRIRRIRRDRVNDFGPLPQPPSGLDPDDVPAHQRWLAETTRAIADGRLEPAGDPLASLPARDVVENLGMAGRSLSENPAAHAARAAADLARAERQAATSPEPEPLLGPDDHSREPEPATDEGAR